MPPLESNSDEEAFSGNESEGLDSIPAKKTTPKAKQFEVDDDDETEEADANGANDDAEEEDGSGEEEEEYVVELIKKHDYDEATGDLLYFVKWLGYNKASDMTWEPAANLETAQDVVEAYHQKIGGAPQPKSGNKKGGRKRKQDVADSPQPAKANGNKKTKIDKGKYTPPRDSNWEESVVSVDAIVDKEGRGPDGKKILHVYLTFKDGRKGGCAMSIVRQKCPQKLIDFYEQHLSFRSEKVEGEAAKNDESD